jgi:hypothetical protein
MMMRYFILLLFFLLSAFGQNLTAPALGMGNNYTAMARGTDALSWNPANLVQMRKYTGDFSFLSTSVLVSNNAFSFSDIGNYFQEGKVLSESDKQDILNLVPDEGLRIYNDVSLNIFSFVYGPYGGGISIVGQGSGLIHKELLRRLFLPNEVGQNYSFSGTGADLYSALKITGGYAQRFKVHNSLPQVAFGANLNYYYGLAVLRVDKSELNFRQSEIDGAFYNQYHIEGKTAGSGGSGISVDLGSAVTLLDDRLDVSFGFKNLLGFINWSGNPEQFVQKANPDSVALGDLINGRYEKTDTTFATDAFTTAIPTTMNLGLAYHLNQDLTVTFDYRQGFGNRMGNTLRPHIGFGAEYYVYTVWPLRAGLSFGGLNGTLLTFGTGYNSRTFDVDYSIGMNRGIYPNGSNGLLTAISFRIKH